MPETYVLTTLVLALARWMYRVCAVRLAETISDFRWKNLCVGADRRVRPRVSIRGWLMDLRMPAVSDRGVDYFDVALAWWMHRVCAEGAGCYAKSDNQPVRLGLAVPFSG